MKKTNNVQVIQAKQTPRAIGPYSQAVVVGDFLFCSGQIGLNPQTNLLVAGGIKKEAHQVLKNLLQVLKTAKISFSEVVKTEIFLTDITDFNQVNEIYAKYFINKIKPARQTVAVAALPKGAKIEVSCVAYVKK